MPTPPRAPETPDTGAHRAERAAPERAGARRSDLWIRRVNLRTVSRLVVIALVILVALIALLARLARAPHDSPHSSGMVGIQLGRAAPAFALADATGARADLTALRGRPIVLTFLYTACTTECSLTPQKLRATAATLGARASGVAWLAVSLDPAGDTPATATRFVAARGLDGRLRYLLGTREALAPVWSAYGITVLRDAAGRVRDARITVGGAARTVGVLVVDAAGRERVYRDATFSSATLAADLQTLV